MRVAFVTNLPSHFHKKLFERIAEGFKTEFFFFSDGTEEWIDKRNVLQFGKYSGHYVHGFRVTSRLRINLGLIRSLIKGRFDIFIQSINGRFEILATYAVARMLHKPFILWTNLWHHPQTLFHTFTLPITKYIYRHSDAIVVYGYHVRDYLVKLGVDEGKIFYSWNVVDNDQFNKLVPKVRLTAVEEQYRLQGRRVVLFVGRITEEKGLRYLLDGFALLPSELRSTLLIVGDGDEKDRLVQLEKNRPDSNVVFIPFVRNEDLIVYYALADVFVLPSITTKTWKEPWGIVLNEAMNQGCPVIATEAVGAAVGGLIEEGKNGIVVPERNADAIQRALNEVLSNNVKLGRMSAYARESIKAWDHVKSFEGFKSAISFVTASPSDPV